MVRLLRGEALTELGAEAEYKSPRSRCVLLLLSLPIAPLFIVSIVLGGYAIQPWDALAALSGGGRGEAALIVESIRLPRTLAAMLGGASLGVAGAILQALFRNPLADPYILGVSAGSSLFLALSILTGATLGLWTPTNPYSLYTAAFIGALVVVIVMIVLSGVVRTTTTILVAGIMFSYLAYAVTSILQVFADIEKLRAFTYWVMGSFSGARWSILGLGLPFLLIFLAAMVFLCKPLNALLLGEDYARSMGMNLNRARMLIVAAAALPVSIVTTIAGSVGFIGLSAPYLARQLTRTSNHFTIIPASALLGSTLATAADLISRLALKPIEIPITAVTALFGAPLVIYLLLRGRGVQV
ncbi:putative siderophore transport system permease protein YfhA [Candidatus Calditenuaceae archaeon HR02]|nr:putative siderophore transport system permease protein YfhA [Candidatus Calditenuaceae archaeon HR02]